MNDTDPVNHLSHYNSGKIEVIEAIEDWKLGFHRGSAIKYIARAGRKDPAKEIEDLEKARWYLAREIELIRANQEERDPVKPDDMHSIDALPYLEGPKEYENCISVEDIEAYRQFLKDSANRVANYIREMENKP